MTATTRRTIGAAAAALLVGVTMALVAIAGEDGGAGRAPSQPDPAFPSLADEPLVGAGGTVAVLRNGPVRCVTVVDVASGAARDLRCERDLTADRPRWTVDGRVEVLRYEGDGLEALVLDPGDGTVRHRRLLPRSVRLPDGREHGRAIAADGSRLVVGADEERTWLEVVSRTGTTERIVEAPIEAWSGFRQATWSPDERLVLVEGDRAVYVVDVATGQARVLLAGAGGPEWRPAARGGPEPSSAAATGEVLPPAKAKPGRSARASGGVR